jgi:hypothetical protein
MQAHNRSDVCGCHELFGAHMGQRCIYRKGLTRLGRPGGAPTAEFSSSSTQSFQAVFGTSCRRHPGLNDSS